MDRFAQGSFEARVLVQAKLELGGDHGGEVPLIGRIAGADRRDILFEVGERRGARLAGQRVEARRHGLRELGVALRVLLVIAQQEVLFGAAAFEQVAGEPVDLIRDHARVGRDDTVGLLRGVAGQIDAANQRKAAETDQPDRGDLV